MIILLRKNNVSYVQPQPWKVKRASYVEQVLMIQVSTILQCEKQNVSSSNPGKDVLFDMYLGL